MRLVIEDLRPWDGTYDFNTDSGFNRREWGWIKRLAGYLPADIEKGWTGLDQELFAVFAIIALARSGRIQHEEASDLFERFQEGGTIRLIGDVADTEDDEDDARPPEQSSNGNGDTSGPGSSESSETSASTLYVTGMPDSGISVSTPATSAS